MSLDTIPALVSALRQYRLLDTPQLDEVSRALQERFPEPRGLARELVRRGWLTPFQVNELFLGRGAGLLLGSYVLLEKLGEGGMGTVFKAKNWKLGRVVALKVIREKRLDSPDAVRRFQREIRASARLDHPNIVRAFDADEVNGSHFFVMEYVEGSDLLKVVKQHGPLPVQTACAYIRQAALGLQHAHEHGLVHRDIKPANLLVTGAKPQAAVVKVLDLGLARVAHTGDGEASTSMTQEGVVMGTADYMAPEQAQESHTVDIRADLYSLGCTLYYLLAGQVPFPTGTFIQKLNKHQFMEPPPLEQLRPGMPAAVVAVVRRLMAKTPAERYQTPAELAAALDALAAPPLALKGPATAPAKGRLPVAEDSATVVAAQQWAQAVSGSADPTTPHASGIDRLQGLRWMVAVAVGAVAVLGLLLLLLRPWQPTEPDSPTDQPAPPSNGRPARGNPPVSAERKRQKEADDALTPLAAKFEEKPTFAEFAKDVAAFKANHGGTPAAVEAAQLLMKLRSPLDQLDPPKIPPEERFAWQPKELVAVLGEHRGRHWGPVTCVAYSPNGKFIASGGEDKVIRLWDVDTMRERMVLKGHTNLRIYSVAFSPDSRRLLSSADDITVRLWDIKTGQELRRFEGTALDYIFNVAFSPDGRQALFASMAEKAVALWDVEGWKELRRFEGHTAKVLSVAFSPDGRRAVSGSDDKTVRLWDVQTGRELGSFEGHAGPVTGVAFAKEGRHILSSVAEGTARLWDIESGKEVRGFQGRRACLSPDGRRLLTAWDVYLALWDVETGKHLQRFEPQPQTGITGMAISPDGHQVTSGCSDGTVRLWDVESGKEVQPLTGPTGQVASIAFSPDDRHLVAGSGKTVSVWDTAEGKEVSRYAGHSSVVTGVAYCPDARQVLSCSDVLVLADAMSGKEIKRFDPSSPGCYGLAVAADGLKAAACARTVVSLFDVQTGKQIQRLEGHTREVFGTAFSPDGRRVLSASWDDTVRLWDVKTGRELRRFEWHRGHAHRVAFSPDGRRAACAHHATNMEVWDLGADTPKPITMELGPAVVASIAFSADGKRLASASEDGRMIVWDPATGAKLREWQMPGPVYDVKFASDGRHLATANGNGTVYILRIPPVAHAPGSPIKALTPEQAKQQQADAAKQLGVPVQVENSIGMKLNLIPAGRFMMGSPENEPGREANEGPEHQVTITKPFYLGVCEVTQKEYEKVTGMNPSQFNKNNGGGPNHPLETVSWDDAVAFCKKLSELPQEKKAGRVYRLPTEAEWEYACRAGTRTAYSFGDDVARLDQYAWFHDNDEGGKTFAVGSKKPNAWGLFDMHGNIWEWCEDFYQPDYYRNTPAIDPRGPEKGTTHVYRGGARTNPAKEERSANRNTEHSNPGPHPNIGFRVVCEICPPR